VNLTVSVGNPFIHSERYPRPAGNGSMESEYPVRASARSMAVVETLLDRDGAGVTELSDALDCSKGAIHNHLQTLVALELVVQSGDEYRVSTRFLDLGTRARGTLPAYQVGRTEVRRLARASGEVAALVLEEHDRAAYVYVAGDDSDETDLRDGLRRPLAAGAAGRAILAHRPSEYRDRILADREDASELRTQLQTAREQGLAFERDSDHPAVAAPLTVEADGSIGAIAVAGPASRMSGKRLEEDIAGLVVSSANSLSVTLARDAT